MQHYRSQWSFEFDHQDKNWMGAIPWASETKLNDDKKTGPPCWFPFHHHHERNSWKGRLEHPNSERKGVVPWEKASNENHFNDDHNAGPPGKWFSSGKGNHRRHTNNMKWNFNEDKTLVAEVPVEKVSNEESTSWSPCAWFHSRQTGVATKCEQNNDENKYGPPSKWLSFRRKCRKSYQNGSGANSRKWNFESINKNWMDAMTWSGAAVLGWYTSQIIHFKIKNHLRALESKNSSENNLLSSILPYVADLNKNDYYVSSVEKIEKLVSDFTPTVHLMSNDKHVSLKTEQNISGSSNSTQSTDTINTDDALGEVLNSIENRLGLAAIENGQYQDGLSLLRSAAHRNHAPAIYNLGLCYEKGLGVTANEKTAMELYRSAAALDHPEALYNLGIYYGQGRGGLKADQDTAVRLLRLAAVQGQQAAIDALKYLEVCISEPHHNDVNTWNYQHPQFSANEHIIPAQSRLFIDNINFLQAKV